METPASHLRTTVSDGTTLIDYERTTRLCGIPMLDFLQFPARFELATTDSKSVVIDLFTKGTVCTCVLGFRTQVGTLVSVLPTNSVRLPRVQGGRGVEAVTSISVPVCNPPYPATRPFPTGARTPVFRVKAECPNH